MVTACAAQTFDLILGLSWCSKRTLSIVGIISLWFQIIRWSYKISQGFYVLPYWYIFHPYANTKKDFLPYFRYYILGTPERIVIFIHRMSVLSYHNNVLIKFFLRWTSCEVMCQYLLLDIASSYFPKFPNHNIVNTQCTK